MKLLQQYLRGGALFTGIGEFLLLGKSRTAIEILRLSTTLKTKQKLEKMYRWKLEEFDRNYTEKERHTSNKIWICWFQGMDNAPELVKRCYQSVVKNNQGNEIVVITTDNISDYVAFPDYIMDKETRYYYTYTHDGFATFGFAYKSWRFWLDATVLCTGKAPDYFFNSDLFFSMLKAWT